MDAVYNVLAESASECAYTVKQHTPSVVVDTGFCEAISSSSTAGIMR